MRREGLKGVGDFLPQPGYGARCGFSECGFELGEHLFDRVEIWTVRRQIDQAGSGCFDDLANANDFMAGQVVHDDHVAWPERWRQELFCPSAEDFTVHRPVECHGRIEAITAQCCDEGGCPPVTIWGFGEEPLADGTTAIAAHHVGGEAGLVDEDEACNVEGRLFLAPAVTRRLDVRPILFGCVQRFF